MALGKGTRGDGAGAFVDDGCACQLGGGGVDLAIKEGDGHALARVALGPGLVQLVVGEEGLFVGRDGVCSVRGSGGQGDGPGRQGQGHRTRSREAQPWTALERVVCGHHWRGSHPSSFWEAGFRSLSEP